jgi:hypothetical protein
VAALHQLDFAERHVELLGNNLHERRAHASAEIDLAGINLDAAVRTHRKKPRHLVGRH